MGKVQPGLSTPNLVVFDEESALFASNHYPQVRFAEVTQYYKERQDCLPEAAEMRGDDPDNKEVHKIRRIMPIPTK